MYATSYSPEFIDTNETLIFFPKAHETVARYKITAVGYLNNSLIETGFTNTVEAKVKGEAPHKIGYGLEKNNHPIVFDVNQNYPNPFNPVTVIDYQLPTDNYITLKVYNVIGHEVATLVDGVKEAGFHSVSFDATNLPSGVLFYQFYVGKYNSVKKMLLVK